MLEFSYGFFVVENEKIIRKIKEWGMKLPYPNRNLRHIRRDN